MIKSTIYKLAVAMLILTTSHCIAKEDTMSFYEEEVTYPNKEAEIHLSGTLTLPRSSGAYPAVILIAGYGPNDRDVTGMGHKYFKVLAEYLTAQGIAVLRYDKRGVGKSTGNWSSVTSAELATDVVAGISYLKTRKEINHDKMGLVGLSEGGLIAAMVASQSPEIAFVLLMAPYVALGIDDIVYHTALQLRADGASSEFIECDKTVRTTLYTIARQEPDMHIATHSIRDAILSYTAHLPESQKLEAEKLSWAITQAKADMWVKVMTSPGYRFFLTYDPAPVLEAIKVPVLAMVGERDLTTSPGKIFPVLRRAFETSGHKDYMMVELPHLNHVFQTCETGALSEYATIKETMSPSALKTISDWILLRTQ